MAPSKSWTLNGLCALVTGGTKGITIEGLILHQVQGLGRHHIERLIADGAVSEGGE